MEIVEYMLIILACVIVSSILGKLIPRIALPLMQITVGFVVALIIPEVVRFQVSSELFLMLFIAPLLFNEARRSNKRALWVNKGAILSLAIGLVLATVVVLGFALYAMVSFLPLAAAFACAAALGPTDAAAVNALNSTISLRPRQKALLSGESLINDASGVVAFQFAITAAVTGSFSVLDAGESFLILFFGGILAGAVIGALALISMRAMQHFGYEDTTLHVIYEVFTPFVVYLLADFIGVSGILAVVTAGLIMANNEETLLSADAAKRKVVSDDFWKVIVFLINGIVFVMLGMQLPQAIQPEVAQSFSLPALVLIVVICALIIFACRFLWIGIMQFHHRMEDTGKRGYRDPKDAIRAALIMTLGGPKGAVTLSMVFTIPLVMQSGELFPGRQTILFITAGVILITLLAANIFLPLVAPRKLLSDQSALRHASIKVLEETVHELERRISDDANPEYIPALRLTHARYQTRLTRQRAQTETCGAVLTELSNKILALQKERALALQGDEYNKLSMMDSIPYYATLQSIRRSVGYESSEAPIGSRWRRLFGQMSAGINRLLGKDEGTDTFERVYYDTCLIAIELEHVAMTYLRDVIAKNDERKVAAKVLLDAHRAVLDTLWSRINYDQDVVQTDHDHLDLEPHDTLPSGMKENFREQRAKARAYANEADATALIIELDNIRHMQERGEISSEVARELRQRVYAIQSSLET